MQKNMEIDLHKFSFCVPVKKASLEHHEEIIMTKSFLLVQVLKSILIIRPCISLSGQLLYWSGVWLVQFMISSQKIWVNLTSNN